MATLLSRTFRSLKPHASRSSIPALGSPTKSSKSPTLQPSSSSSKDSWCVYLILSTNFPIKTYVGVTNNFSRRLKQHNGELKGGAKASRAGRPWICACLIQGFDSKSKACEFESKWKTFSRKLPRKGKDSEPEKEANNSKLLLQHKRMALNRIKDLMDCSLLEIDWRLDSS